jgi:RNA polymerase sigma-70 factor (ECF subfamily)
MASFRGESAFESWLHRLAVNVVLEDRRATRRRTARVESSEDPSTVERVGRQATNDERMDIEAAIAGLPTKTRHVFVLHDIEGYRHEEISRLTGAAQGTVRAQLFRARRMLMEALSR